MRAGTSTESPVVLEAPASPAPVPLRAPRLHYIDWLRVLAVLLLFPFHVTRVFNASEPFYVKAPDLSRVLDYTLWFVSTWHMQLLFFLAGASTFLAVRKRSGRQYVGERVTRLLLPFVFGFFVLIPPQTWYGGRFNEGYEGSFWHYLTSGDFLVYNIRDGGDYFGGFGIGHLWFILVLFLISLIVLPLVVWARRPGGQSRIQALSRRLARPVWWVAPPFLVLIGAALPELELDFFYNLAFFLLGFVALADGAFAESAVRHRWVALVAGAALGLFWVFSGDLRDSLPDPSLERAGLSLLGGLGTWLVLVGLVGLGKRHLDRPSSALRYLAEGSYPIYILHQTVIVVVAFYLVGLAIPTVAMWPLLLTVSVVGTFGLYELVRRVGVLRFLFGMRRRPPVRHTG